MRVRGRAREFVARYEHGIGEGERVGDDDTRGYEHEPAL
jgi:hypothetical protein